MSDIDNLRSDARELDFVGFPIGSGNRIAALAGELERHRALVADLRELSIARHEVVAELLIQHGFGDGA